MFKAIGKYFRALGYLATGRIDAARRAISTDPHVVRATYDRVIEDKTTRVQEYKDAVARMIAQEEKKLAKVKELSDEVNKLESLKEGAAAKARTLLAEKKAAGQSVEQIQADPEFVRCQTAFNDFDSSLKEKHERIAELEEDLAGITASIANHKQQLTDLMREIDKLKSEASETVADMITAKEEEQIADMISGISQDRTSQELAELRELRHESKAKARISREMAGTDTKAQENEFMQYAQATQANDEFAQLIGLAGETDKKDAAADTPEAAEREDEGTSGGGGPSKLPEA